MAAALPVVTNNSTITDILLDYIRIAVGGGSLAFVQTEDAAHASGDKGVMMLGIYDLTDTQLSSTQGDYTPMKMDELGNLRVSGGPLLEKPTANFTRPANTTAYAAGQIINANAALVPFSFGRDAGAPVDRKFKVFGGHIVSSDKTVTLPELELLLFTNSFAITADGTEFAPTYANLSENYIGSIYFDNFKTYGTRMLSEGIMNVPEIVATPSAGTVTIYGVLVTRNGWTPISGQQFKIFLDAHR